MSYPEKTGKYLLAVHPEKTQAKAYDAGSGDIQLIWPAEYGPPPTREEVEGWIPVPSLDEGTANYRAANEAAKEQIFALMAKVAGTLIASRLFTDQTVNDEGAEFVSFHRNPILDFQNSGRNKKSTEALYNAVASEGSRARFSWLEANQGYILGVFAAELGIQ